MKSVLLMSLSACVLLVSLAVTAGLAGCKPETPSGASVPAGKYIGFVGVGADDPLWQVLRAGAERFPSEPGHLAVRFFTPQTASPQEQVRLLRGLVGDLNLKGLCVQVSDPEALQGVLGEMAVHGVSVVSMVRDVPEAYRTVFCGVDEGALGRALAEAAAEAADGEGNVMVLVSDLDDPAYGRRLEAFRDAIRLEPDIHVLGYVECQADGVAARRELREGSRRFPSLEVWVMLDNWAFRGWDEAEPLVGAGCRLIAVDPLPEVCKYLESGLCFALVGGVYGDIGYEAMRNCRLAIGSPRLVKLEFLVPAMIVRASELEEYRAQWRLWTRPVAGSRPELEPKGSAQNREP
ncbi:MAG: substrate-binding domain-containing protein [Phycisphaerales bacterium]|nr:MAG: substrate-binding domain-containing protein [Phycisphaerales bacterium]